ncbi:diguanylate cyclase [Metabacillus mangrovi]|uniref:diguanylate cyclase n=1 Tax=Metabacillus mangrovi TaxID=1491830 RepID=UPI00139114D8
MLIRDLITHTAILTSFLFIAGQIFRNHPTDLNVYTRLFTGLTAGVLGTLLMVFYSIPVDGQLLLDFRFFAVLLAAMYGGMSASFLSASIINAARIAIYGWSFTTMTAVAALYMIAAICTLIAKAKLNRLMKAVLMNFSTVAVVMIAYYTVLQDRGQLLKLYQLILLVGLPSGFFLTYVADYIKRSNIQFHNLKNISSKDYLTGLNNVRRFDELLNTSVRRALKTRKNLSMLLIDLDYFKRVNDTYGHPAGDAVLKQTARLLELQSRDKEEVSRNGGEEFSIVLYNCNLQSAAALAEKIRRAIEEEPFVLPDGTVIRLTASIGAACYPENTETTALLYETADQGLYAAKRTGRNRVEYLGAEKTAMNHT